MWDAGDCGLRIAVVGARKLAGIEKAGTFARVAGPLAVGSITWGPIFSGPSDRLQLLIGL
jgi:hypothetical protein